MALSESLPLRALGKCLGQLLCKTFLNGVCRTPRQWQRYDDFVNCSVTFCWKTFADLFRATPLIYTWVEGIRRLRNPESPARLLYEPLPPKKASEKNFFNVKPNTSGHRSYHQEAAGTQQGAPIVRLLKANKNKARNLNKTS